MAVVAERSIMADNRCFMGAGGLEYVNQVDGGFCRAYVIVVSTGVDLLAASGTLVHVVAGVDVAHSDLRLDVPVF